MEQRPHVDVSVEHMGFLSLDLSISFSRVDVPQEGAGESSQWPWNLVLDTTPNPKRINAAAITFLPDVPFWIRVVSNSMSGISVCIPDTWTAIVWYFSPSSTLH